MARSETRRATEDAAASMPPAALAATFLDASLSQARDVNWDEVGYDNVPDEAHVAGERRRLQRELRSLIKKTTAEQSKFYEAQTEAVQTVLDESADLLKQTRQTTEAAIDAALVIRVSELAYKRTTHFLSDRTGDAGVNLDDLVARCRDYMRFGRGITDRGCPDLSPAQRKRRRVEALAHRDGGGGGERRRGQLNGASSGAASAESDEDVVVDGVRTGRPEEEEDESDDDDDGGSGRRRPERLDWTHFGQYACLPHTRRPGLARFLPRTPLSADEKTRVLRKRAAALRVHELQEVRPQVLQAHDLGASQNSDLTALATDILRQLRRAVERGQAQVQSEYEQMDEDGLLGAEDDEDGRQRQLQTLMDRYGIRSDGGADLIRFAVNPRSFAQTVENFFYISFLVRDGRVGLGSDDNGLPSICRCSFCCRVFSASVPDNIDPTSEEEIESAKEANNREDTQKHQLILSIDMAMWRDMTATFNIKESMIAHRDAPSASHPGGRAWFS